MMRASTFLHRLPSRLIILAAALAAVALFLDADGVPPAKAQAQDSVTLVSNLQQPGKRTVALVSGQKFLWGCFDVGEYPDGYTIESVTAFINVSSALTATERGRIGAGLYWYKVRGGSIGLGRHVLASLPATFPVGDSEVEFKFPGGFVVRPQDHDYDCFVIFVDDPVDKLSWWVTGSPDEDRGATSGWSISDFVFYKAEWLQSPGLVNNESLMFAVKGKARILSPPGALSFFSFGGGQDNGLQVGWHNPWSGLRVTGHDVHYTSASSSAVADDAAASGSDPAAGWVVWNDPVHTTDHGDPVNQRVITGLTNGLEYRVRVRAKNHLGAGPWTVGKHTVGLTLIPMTPDPDLLTGLTINDGVQDLPLKPNIANAVGLGGPDTLYAVHVNPGVRSLTLTPTWTNTSIATVTTEVRDMSGHTGVATSSGWGIAESGTAKSMPLPGHVTRINLYVIGAGGTPTYQIYAYHNRDWESANNRLRQLIVRFGLGN